MKKYIALLIISLFSIAENNAQITISTSLDEAINKAIEKNSSIKNKELEIEKINLQKKGVWNKYIPKVEASGLYSYYDNKLTIDAAPVTVPLVNLTVGEGKQTFDNYGNIFHGSLMAKTILFSGMQIPNGAKALEQKAKGAEFLKESEKDGVIKAQLFPSKILKGSEVSSNLDRNEYLLKIATPFLGIIYETVANSGFFILLTDNEGCIIRSVGDAEIITESERLNMIVGAYMNEKNIGTNAMGTSISEN
ncbi:MAG TPA: TolC family protein, partial [Flavobacterium sp.]|nr:TolC family protein [Flavobacterium sp.]